MNEAVKYLRDFGKKVIDSRRSAMEDEEPVLEDYLTCMLKADDDDSSLTFDDMLDEFVTVFIVGKRCFIYVPYNMFSYFRSCVICVPSRVVYYCMHLPLSSGLSIKQHCWVSPLIQRVFLGFSSSPSLQRFPLTCMHRIMQFAVAMKWVLMDVNSIKAFFNISLITQVCVFQQCP